MSKLSLSKGHTATESEMLFSLDEEKVEMRINEAAMAHVINRLTDMYSNPIEASVREVISNAIDTTKRLPKDERQPIKVIMPTELNPVFTVIDKGEGMSKDVIKEIYSQYGSSTKSSDMTQVGAYGLGAKAPLSYCSQFVVESTRDGITTELLISSEMGGNYTRIVSSVETGKENGTKVSIPVSSGDSTAFHNAGRTYYDNTIALDIQFSGVEYTDKNELLYVGAIPLPEVQEGFAVKVYTREKNLGNLLRIYCLSKQSNHFGFLLSGWDYTKNNFRHTSPTLILDLVPGLVDFSSSRDEITENARFKMINELLTKKSYDLITKVFTEKIKSGELEDEDVYAAIGSAMNRVSRWQPLSQDEIDFLSSFNSNSGINYYEQLTKTTGSTIYSAFSRDTSQYNKANIVFSKGKDINAIYSNKVKVAEIYSEENENDELKKFSAFGIARLCLFSTSQIQKYVFITEAKDELKKIVNRSTSYMKNINNSNCTFFVSELTEKALRKQLKGIVKLGENVTFLSLGDYIDKAKAVRNPNASGTKTTVPFSIRMTLRYVRTVENALKLPTSSYIFDNLDYVHGNDLKLDKSEKDTTHSILVVRQNCREYGYPSVKLQVNAASLLLNGKTRVRLGYTTATNINSKNVDELVASFDEIVFVDDVEFRSTKITEKINTIPEVTLLDELRIPAGQKYARNMILSSNSGAIALILHAFVEKPWRARQSEMEWPEGISDEMKQTFIDFNENNYSLNVPRGCKVIFEDLENDEIASKLTKLIDETEENSKLYELIASDIRSLKDVPIAVNLIETIVDYLK